MEDIDTMATTDNDEDELFLRDVIADEHDLLYLDSYLREALTGGGVYRDEVTPGA